MRLDKKKNEVAAEAGEQKGDEEDIVKEGDGDVGGEGGSDGGPPLPPHLLLAGGDVGETKNNYSNYERKEKEREAARKDTESESGYPPGFRIGFKKWIFIFFLYRDIGNAQRAPPKSQ